MNRNYILITTILIAVTITIISCGSGTGEPNPQITSIQPTEGPAGSAVTISGSGFGTEPSVNTVTFDGVKAQVNSASDSELQATVPGGAETGPVAVSVGNVTVTGPTFTVVAEAPGIASVEPDSGVAGDEVTVTGMNFSATASEITITFDGVAATIQRATETELVTQVPEGASDGPVEVTVNGKGTTGPNFDVITYGALQVNVVTTGGSKDEDGYELTVDGQESQSADTTDTVYFGYIEQGSHSLELTGLASNCGFDGGNPSTFEITAGDTTSVSFEISCKSVLKNKIVFISDRDDQTDLYVMNPDGSDVFRLTETPEEERHPNVSSDGIKVVYWQQNPSDGSNYGSIWVVNADGSDPVQLTSVELGALYPVWSPNGDRIAFSKGGEIYVMDADGSNRQNLTNDSAFDFAPSWAPDGESITFTSDRDGDGRDIYSIGVNGTGLENLTNDSFYNAYSSWSPDGSQIAFLSNEENTDDIYVPFDLYVMDADGKNRIKVADLSVTGFRSGDRAGPPSWSPDGTKIVIGNKNGSSHEIYKVSVDGSGSPEWLTLEVGIDNIYPHWSPVE